MRRALCELFGTFCLVFAGTGAIVADHATEGRVTHVGVALAFGLVVMAMVATLGEASGAHINPAVTLAFWADGRFEARRVPAYVLAQCVGAVAASALLRAMFPGDPTLGATAALGGVVWRAFVMEAVLSWVLMLVILGVATGSREKGLLAGVTIGGVVGLAALFAGPVSGASMNPARSLGPALASGVTGELWVYLMAPVLGALLAVPTARVLLAPVGDAVRGPRRTAARS